MTFKIKLLLALVPALIPSLCLATTSTDAPMDPPRIPLEHLRSALSPSSDERSGSGINLHRLLHDSHGILRIAVGSSNGDDVNRNGFRDLRRRALSHLCDCPTFHSSSSSPSSSKTSPTNNGSITSFEEALKSHPKDLQQIDLPDGTVRRTLASATVGFGENDVHKGTQHAATVLELPSWVEDTCGRDAYNSFEDLRDAVSDVVGTFVELLDQEKKASDKASYNMNEGEAGQSYQQILSGANHLEHFHVYTKSSGSRGNNINQVGNDNRGDHEEHGSRSNSRSEKETPTLDYHTDAGFFLSFVPAMDCHTRTTDSSSFFLKGKSHPLSFEEDEVVIMMGAGAQYWLPDEGRNSPSFLAASHALRLVQNTHRTWYGKMHILPSSFTSTSNGHMAKYGDALGSFQLEDYDAHVPASPVDGCGTNIFNGNMLPSVSHGNVVQKQSRRRLQHVNSPANCNNVTNFFCWHQCVDIPESEYAEAYVQDGYSLYCLDPAILASSDSIPDATAPCKEGYVHNPSCSGKWQETDDNAPAYKLPYEANKAYPIPDTEEKYCYGGTSMYMDGFHWEGTTCVIYLFQSWILTTPGKFALAAIGSILFGIALEFVLWKRRSVYTMRPGLRRLCLSALVYGIQLTMGYFIMLVVMTYSAPLFISTVGGMMLGHCMFNAQDSIVKRWEAKKAKSNDDEVGDTHLEGTRTPETTTLGSRTELGSYQNGESYRSDDDSDVEDCCGMKSPPQLKGGPDESTRLKNAISDGATPCCQYTL